MSAGDIHELCPQLRSSPPPRGDGLRGLRSARRSSACVGVGKTLLAARSAAQTTSTSGTAPKAHLPTEHASAACVPRGEERDPWRCRALSCRSTAGQSAEGCPARPAMPRSRGAVVRFRAPSLPVWRRGDSQPLSACRALGHALRIVRSARCGPLSWERRALTGSARGILLLKQPVAHRSVALGHGRLQRVDELPDADLAIGILVEELEQRRHVGRLEGQHVRDHLDGLAELALIEVTMVRPDVREDRLGRDAALGQAPRQLLHYWDRRWRAGRSMRGTLDDSKVPRPEGDAAAAAALNLNGDPVGLAEDDLALLSGVASPARDDLNAVAQPEVTGRCGPHQCAMRTVAGGWAQA
mmetsp:Transcript_62810/g.161654  ORF Transcript_62810/g.161654 Transcript_62810/m.161654 type:complete len:355 (-) Transcript_62810:2-1066(-)